MWTQFMDMHSGGDSKEGGYEYIYIELPEGAAVNYFESRFNHSPRDIACDCCGPNYSISEGESLEVASAYERKCDWGKDDYDLGTAKITLSRYAEEVDVLIISAADIERIDSEV